MANSMAQMCIECKRSMMDDLPSAVRCRECAAQIVAEIKAKREHVWDAILLRKQRLEDYRRAA